MKTLLNTIAASAFLFSPALLFAADPAPAASAKQAKGPQRVARLEFNPGGGPWSGEKAFQGASWTALGPSFGQKEAMHARAGLGDKFPVQDTDGVTLFEVVLENGTDDHLVVAIASDEVDQKVRLDRDKKAEIKVAGRTYSLRYPTQQVAAAPGERPSTNKATIFVTRMP